MPELSDLELLVNSRVPIIAVQTHEERRAVDMFTRLAVRLGRPAFLWTVTEGLRRLDVDLGNQQHNAEPTAVLRQIKSGKTRGLYLLADFHPYLDDPVHVRLLKEIAHEHERKGDTIVLLSHSLDIPDELSKLSARFDIALPDEHALMELVKQEARDWAEQYGSKVSTDPKTLNRLVRNLTGLTTTDARRLARQVIFDDGAITESDLPEVGRAKYELLNKDGLLAFEYETERFANVGGLERLRKWLVMRRDVFLGRGGAGLDPPKGILLLGVQGCGKSLAAKATAGVFGLPLLRLDFAGLYNKFFGESERNLREALAMGEVMAPCVLWIDEIEKGLATGENDGGTSRRVLGTLLTWMAERRKPVFMVATANDIEALPPELIRKGRFDEIFFVDLPDPETRRIIFEIHLRKRGLDADKFDLGELAEASEGFSGAEIEQAVVSALYAAHAAGRGLSSADVRREIAQTQPLSRIMAEKIEHLRNWARARTVPAD